MKLVLEYLERAVQMEKLASDETKPDLRDELLKQAASYRKLAAKRAEESGLPLPSSPDHSSAKPP